MMKICIFASIGSENLGDELILKNEVQLLKQEFGTNTQFRVASYNSENPFFQSESVSYFEYFPIGIKSPKNILRNIKNFYIFYKNIFWSDMIVIGGGGIIYDSEKQSNANPLNQWLFRSYSVKILRKKLYFYALGIDIKNPKNTKKLKNIFQSAFKITVRDSASQKQLSDVGIESELVDDPVMSDNTEASFSCKEKEFKIELCLKSRTFNIPDFKNYDFSGKKVGLALRSGYFGNCEIQEQKVIKELCGVIEQGGGHIVFLPHSFHESDAIANDYTFLNQFLTEGREIKTSMQEVYDIYTKGETDINITMRLHSIILSHVYRIPQIVLSYSTKTDEVIKKLKK